ncbi:alkaline phosphatase D [uncultured Thiomicrorhabdus sp.]
MSNIKFSRRDFLKYSMASSLIISSGLQSGCGGATEQATSSDLNNSLPDVNTPNDNIGDDQNISELNSVTFPWGVASGDPDDEGVVIWTKLGLDGETDSQEIYWEVATDMSFSELVNRDSALVSSDNGFIAKVLVQGLLPNTQYYYRFTSNETLSPTGMTKTLPSPDDLAIDSIKMAVLSCSNFPAGYFNAYNLASQESDLDVVLHLGDYIYEYGPGGYAGAEALYATGERGFEPNKEIITLNDYRQRYAQYRTDENLQELHRKHPWIVVWDDHEVADNTYKDGAENHNDGEGDFEQRRANAIQAYFEWLPIRPLIPDDEGRIYRKFQFGNLMDLIMLDTRVIGRDQQVAMGEFQLQEAVPTEQNRYDHNRTMLGIEQRDWLFNQLSTSDSTWQILGQQVLMMRMEASAEFISGFIRDLSGEAAGDQFTLALESILGALDQASPKIPYNSDAWDGYGYEREILLRQATDAPTSTLPDSPEASYPPALRKENKRFISLAGDTHNSWAGKLTLADGTLIGAELAIASVTSPGIEGLANGQDGAEDANQVLANEYTGEALAAAVDDLQYSNPKDKGFMLLTVTPNYIRSDWKYVDTILDKNYTQNTDVGKTLYVSAKTMELTENIPN